MKNTVEYPKITVFVPVYVKIIQVIVLISKNRWSSHSNWRQKHEKNMKNRKMRRAEKIAHRAEKTKKKSKKEARAVLVPRSCPSLRGLALKAPFFFTNLS